MEKWEENLKKMLDADKDSNRLIFETDEEKLDFVLNCEKVYKKTTAEHVAYFIKNEFEGNVDENRWYRFACQLRENGHNL